MKEEENKMRDAAVKKIIAFLFTAFLAVVEFPALAAVDSTVIDLSAQSGTVMITSGGTYTLTGTLNGG